MRLLGALVPLFLLAASLNASTGDDPAFKLVTRDGHTYVSSRIPAAKKGYLFLTDPEGNFYSVPLDVIDWQATRAANLLMTGELLDQWNEGPVRYLLDASDTLAYRALRTDDERLDWISRFWASFDPTPSTFYNERRYEFWTRVQHANAQFVESTKPGWKTDRGRIYILLGPPSDIESFPVRSGNDARFDARYTADSPAGYPRHTIPPRGVVRWTYRDTGIPGVDSNMVIAFREDSTGEYYLSSDTVDYDRVFRDTTSNITSLGDEAHRTTKNIRSHRSGSAGAKKKAEAGRVGVTAASALSLLSDLGRVQDVSRMDTWTAGVVEAREYFGAFPLHSAYHFYRSQEGLTYVEINMTLAPGASPGGGQGEREPRSSKGAPVSLEGRLVSESDPGLEVEFSREGGFAALPFRDPDGVRWIYQSGVGVKPGSYALALAIVDNETGRVGSWRESVEVPDLSAGGLLLSDLVLAREIETRSASTQTPYKEPFVLGNLKVVPQIGSTYRGGEDLAFYYQIYGAPIDPGEGQPDLDLEYRFEKLEQEGPHLVADPIHLERQHELSQAYSFPLRGWPEGSYRVTVQVTDRISGMVAEREAIFSVQP